MFSGNLQAPLFRRLQKTASDQVLLSILALLRNINTTIQQSKVSQYTYLVNRFLVKLERVTSTYKHSKHDRLEPHGAVRSWPAANNALWEKITPQNWPIHSDGLPIRCTSRAVPARPPSGPESRERSSGQRQPAYSLFPLRTTLSSQSLAMSQAPRPFSLRSLSSKPRPRPRTPKSPHIRSSLRGCGAASGCRLP
jgi:hypothetical protein